MGKKSLSATHRRLLGALVAVAAVLAGLLVAPLSAQAAVPVATAVAQILSDTNALRAAAGKPPLVESTQMDAVAQNWSAQMYANAALTHNPNYSTQIPAGWTSAGENIASGYTYTSVVDAWHKSAGHYANIIGNYNSIGIGYYELNGQTWFTQDFGNYATVPSPAPASSGAATNAALAVTTKSPALSFVLASYTDVLGRTPSTSDSGVAYWTAQISQGASRGAIAASFNNSDEYRSNKITAAYADVLQRTPDASGAGYWLSAMQQGWIQPDDVHRIFLSSDEFYSRQGGGTPAGYVSALYTDIIGRAPDSSGLSYWMSVLGSSGRDAVVNGLWFADETFRVRVAQAYQQLLGRPASGSDQTYWSGVARQIGITGMRTTLMTSDEYWNRAASRFP